MFTRLKLQISSRSRLLLPLALLAALLYLCTLSATRLQAAPDANFFLVTVNFDGADAAPGDGICAISSALGGGCSVRAAIQEANALPGANIIKIPSGSFGGIPANGLLITDPAGLTILGTTTTILGVFPIFRIQVGAQAIIDGVTIGGTGGGYRNEGNLTLTNGGIDAQPVTTSINTPDFTGIQNLGALTVTNFLIRDLLPGSAAGILINGNQTRATKTTLRNVKFLNNQATALVMGGGNNQIEITDSSFDQNTLGMQLNGNLNQVTIRNSTISRNLTGGVVVGSGAVEFPLSVRILNSTFSGNQGNSALRLTSSDSLRAQVALNNVTITNNDGNNAVGGIFAPNTSNPNPALSVQNSIIAGNTSFVPLVGSQVGEGSQMEQNAADCNGTIFSKGHNLIGSVAGCTIKGDTASNLIAPNPLLGALADNGGATLTHALQTGSPARNAGDLACEASDQTGTSRPQGTACDIGAYEAPVSTAVAPILTSLNPTSTIAPGNPFTLVLTGSNFNANSRVHWPAGDNYVPSTFTNSKLETSIPASELTFGRITMVTVFDQGTGLVSNALPFTTNNPFPTVLDNNPKALQVNTSAQVVISGTNFIPTSQVSLTGNISLQTQFLNPQTLRVFIPASAARPISNTIRLFVSNPGPGGGSAVNTGSVGVVSITLGTGSFHSILKPSGDVSTLSLGWVHPLDWRLLESVEVRLLDENDQVMLWLSFAEAFGQKGAIVLRSADGEIASMGFPGDDTLLESDIGVLELAASQIDAQPGTTVTINYAFRFNAQVQGRTFKVEFSANDKVGEAQGFEATGTLTVPTAVFLPLVTK